MEIVLNQNRKCENAGKDGTSGDWKYFRIHQRGQKINLKEEEYKHKLAGNINSDQTSSYKYVNKEIKSLVRKSGNYIWKQKKCGKIHAYFGSVWAKERTSKIPYMLGIYRLRKEELNKINVSKEIVLGKLIGWKTEKSPGSNNLYPREWKEMALETVDVLVPILQISSKAMANFVNSGVANVTPQLKKRKERWNNQ